jgi:Predicted AAA-ATPase
MFSDLNNLYEDSVLTGSYAKHYGFTEEEVDYLLKFYKNADKWNVKEWYNGYTIGDEKAIYNPWSVVNYLKDQSKKTPWADSGRTDLIKNIMISDDMQDELGKLRDETLSKKIKDVSIENLSDNSREEVIWPLLLYSGYLTLNDGDDEDETNGEYPLRIPNKEISTIYNDFLKDWFQNKVRNLGIDDSPIDLSSVEDVKNKYLEIINAVIKQKKIGKKNESLFHHLITGRHLFERGKGTHYISPELHSGEGYVDHIFYPKKGQNKTAVFMSINTLKMLIA